MATLYDEWSASGNLKQEPAKKEKKGGWLSNFISEAGGTGGALAGGAAGAALGSVVPGLGTVIGGLLGAGLGGFGGGTLGSAAEQKVQGEEKVDWGKALGEGALEGVFSAGPLRLAKLAGAGGKVAKELAKGGGKLAAQQAAEEAVSKPLIGGLVGKLGRGAPGNIAEGAKNKSMEGFGLTVGQNAGRGKVLTPEGADTQFDFINNGAQKYGGIRPGTPINQAKDAQIVHDNVIKTLDDELTKVDRQVKAPEIMNIATSMQSKVGSNAAVTGSTKTMEKFQEKLAKAKSVRELENIRKEADNVAFTSTGAGKTSAAAQAHAVRDAIDEFTTGLSPSYKAVKGDYMLSKDVLDNLSKANKSAKGVTIPLVNVEVGKQALPGITNKITGKMASTAPTPTTPNIQQPGLVGTAARVGAGSLINDALQPAADPAVDTEATGMPTAADMGGLDIASLTAGADRTAQLQAGIEQAALQALAQGDSKGLENIMKVASLLESMNKSSAKPLSAEASKVISNANSGLTSLAQMEKMISEQGGVSKATLIPGRELFGSAGANALGTANYDNAAKNLTDVITRLRTGAALTESEEKFYQAQIPQAFDSPEVVQQKLGMFRDLFQSVANRTGSAGNDMQSLIEGAQ